MWNFPLKNPITVEDINMSSTVMGSFNVDWVINYLEDHIIMTCRTVILSIPDNVIGIKDIL